MRKSKPTAQPTDSAAGAIGAYLKGQRVNLRGVLRADLEHVRRWWDNAEATQYIETGSCPSTEASLEAFYKAATDSPNAVVFTVVERESKKPIVISGLYEIFWPGRRAEFRSLIGEPSVFDKGYGTEATQLTVDYAFIRLNMEAVHLGVNSDNDSP